MENFPGFVTEIEPAFPPEIFSEIIDALATRIPGADLTDAQRSTLLTCSLVCKTFQALSEPHIYRYISFGIIYRSWRLQNLIDLLKSKPIIANYIRHINLDLKRRSREESTNTDPRLDDLLSLPNVESIDILYSRTSYSQPQTLSFEDTLGEICHRIIDSHVSRSLRSLSAKKITDLHFSKFASQSMLSTLVLDRCDISGLKEAMPSVNNLTLRKIVFPVSTLSYFPNLEVLRFIRMEITSSKSIDGASKRLPAPSFRIKTLVLERCTEYGKSEVVGRSASILWDYYISRANEEGIEPFEHLHTLGITFRGGEDEMLMENAILKYTPHLQDIILIFPYDKFVVGDLICGFRIVNHHTLSFRYFSTNDIEMPDLAAFSTIQSFVQDIVPLLEPSVAISGDIFRNIQFNWLVADAPNQTSIALLTWGIWVAMLARLYPNVAHIREAELYLFNDEPFDPILGGQTTVEQMADDVAKREGRVLGVHLSGINNRSIIPPLKLVFSQVNIPNISY